MVDDLGARLVRAGLVTRAQLADTLALAPAHAGALVQALVRAGLSEDALAGFFLAEGFGPLMDAGDLAAADTSAVRRLPGRMALDVLALPMRSSPAGLVVAMVAPSDRHVVGEIARVVGTDVLPTVARASELRAAIRRAYPDAPSEPVAAPAAAAERASESEPPVLELVRKRTSIVDPSGYQPARSSAPPSELRLGPRLTASDDEAVVPLVRTKALLTPTAGVSRDDEVERVVSKSFPRPEKPAGWSKGEVVAYERSQTAEYEAIPSEPPPAPAPHDDASAPPRSPQDEPVAAVPGPVSAPPRPASSLPPGFRVPKPGELGASRTSSRTSAPRAPRPITSADEDRWDAPAPSSLPASPPAPPTSVPRATNKIDRMRASSELAAVRAPTGDVGSILAAMRGARDRDEVVRLACEGALTVARAVVFFALRKGVLKGWDGAGGGLSRDGVRNLWIPTSSPSQFKRVLDDRKGFTGPYGTAIADGLFRAAVGSRGGDVSIQPVIVSDKVVGLLCVDDVGAGAVGAQRVEILAHAVSEAFKRIIVDAKGS